MAFTKTAVSFLWKIFTYKQGANAAFSFLASSSMTTTLWASGYFSHFNDIFLKDADPKSILLPFLVEAVMIIFFFLLSGGDFILGQRVARTIRKEKFKAERFFDTIIKNISIILVTSMLMFLCFVVITAGYQWLWPVLMFSLCFFWILCIGFEFSSIGRNLETLNGSKPAIFKFFDKILLLLQDKAIKKVESSFNLDIDDDEKKSTDTE